MLTRITIRNFKVFEEAEIDLGSPVIFVGPNNSGKSSALHALSLWNAGVKRWNEKRSGRDAPEKRPGVTINRRDLVAVPVPHANLLWRDLRIRNVVKTGAQPRTENVRIEIIVEGVTHGESWTCGLEFDYANEESIYCRPLRTGSGKTLGRIPVPEEARSVEIAFLPPMSGLAATETRLEPGAINVRIGEARTAEVLRNLCHHVCEEMPEKWDDLTGKIERLFGVEIDPPRHVVERGEITMSYRERGVRLDLSSSGRGLQQTLLLMAYMYMHPGAVLLLDEPDAHLEILRQRQTYHLITEMAGNADSQIIVASHSEVLLDEAVGSDAPIISFVGQNPHQVADRGSQLRKALRDIPFDHYLQAEEARWVLYLEGSTDLHMLQAFAERLDHEEARQALERPFVHYVGNQPGKVRDHFHGLREGYPTLRGVALFDRLERPPPEMEPVVSLMWERREIENYLCSGRGAFEKYAEAEYAGIMKQPDEPGPLFAENEAEKRVSAMREAIEETVDALARLRGESPWDPDVKISENFLEPLFRAYHKNLGLPEGPLSKKDYHRLVQYIPEEELAPEVRDKLDAIAQVAASAEPVGG